MNKETLLKALRWGVPAKDGQNPLRGRAKLVDPESSRDGTFLEGASSKGAPGGRFSGPPSELIREEGVGIPFWGIAGALMFFCLVLISPSLAADKAPDPPDSQPKPEMVEMMGRIARERAHLDWFKWQNDQILVLQCATESYNLLRGRDKRVVAKLESCIGKLVTVLGELVQANRRHPRRAIRVFEFKETTNPAIPLLEPKKP